MIPIAGWLPATTRADLRADLRAGLTVGVILVPQAMAYAVIAGVPPIYGLYAALIPLLIYPLLGTSRHLAAGPIAVDMLIVAAGIGLIARGDPARYLALTAVLAAMVGMVQIFMGVARLGVLVSLLARPVIVGFVWAAAIIIAMSQAGALTGMDLPRSGYVLVMLRDLFLYAEGLHAPTLAVGAGSVFVLLALRRVRHLVPGALVVVVGGIVAVRALGLDSFGVELVGEVPAGLPPFALPFARAEDLRDLVPTAVTLALVQFMTVISLGRIYAARHGYRVDPNRELIAVGTGNLVGSLFRSLPASGSLSRTAVNEQAGARTPLANWAAAAVVALSLLFLTPIFASLPMAALGAIIVVAVLGMIRPSEAVYFFRTKRRDGYLALFTFVVTLIMGIREGILLGIAASAFVLLFRLSRPHVVELGHLPGTRLFRNLARSEHAAPMESMLLLRFDGGFSYLSADFLRGFILDKATGADRPLRAVILDGITINDLDTTAVDALDEIAEILEQKGIALHVTGLIGPVRDVVQRSGLYTRLGRDHFHRSPHQAVKYILQRWDAEDGGERLAGYRDEVLRDEPAESRGNGFGVRVWRAGLARGSGARSRREEPTRGRQPARAPPVPQLGVASGSAPLRLETISSAKTRTKAAVPETRAPGTEAESPVIASHAAGETGLTTRGSASPLEST